MSKKQALVNALNDVELRRKVEATYWTYRILGEFPDDASSEMKELVLKMDAERQAPVEGSRVVDFQKAIFNYVALRGGSISPSRARKISQAWMKKNPGRGVEEFISSMRGVDDGKPLHYADPTGNAAVGNRRGRAW